MNGRKGVMGSRDYILITILYGTLLLGIIFPEASQVMAPTIKYFMMLLLFLSFIRIAPGDVWQSLRATASAIALGGIVRLVLVPVMVYYVIDAVFPWLALPLLLLAGMPTGVAAPFFVSLCRGNISFTLVMAIVTSLLVPFTLPVMVDMVHGMELEYDLLSLGLFLAMIIFVPLIASAVVRGVFPRLLDRLNGGIYPLSLVVIAAVNFGALGRYVPYLRANLDQLIIALITVLLLVAVMVSIGWWTMPGKGWENRMASAGSQLWINNVMLIALAVHLDNPIAAILGALYFVPSYGMVFFFSVRASRAGAPSEA